MIRSSVVLPEPLGPEQGRELAVGDLEAHVAQRREGPVGLADVLDGDAHVSFRSTIALAARVTRASIASSEATAKAATKLYSL